MALHASNVVHSSSANLPSDRNKTRQEGLRSRPPLATGKRTNGTPARALCPWKPSRSSKPRIASPKRDRDPGCAATAAHEPETKRCGGACVRTYAGLLEQTSTETSHVLTTMHYVSAINSNRAPPANELRYPPRQPTNLRRGAVVGQVAHSQTRMKVSPPLPSARTHRLACS